MTSDRAPKPSAPETAAPAGASPAPAGPAPAAAVYDGERLVNGRRKKTLPFGWCSDGNHHHCRTSYLSDFGVTAGQVVTCICECHKDGPCEVCGDVSNHYQGLTTCRAGKETHDPAGEGEDEGP